MKTILSSQILKIPSKVSIRLDGRKVEVKGPRGVLKRDFSHMQISLKMLHRKAIEVSVWFGARRETECLNTLCSLIKNMIKGVTVGVRYKMRLVYAHYPINVVTDPSGKQMTIKNYIGQRRNRVVDYPESVKIYPSKIKDELIVEGNDLTEVSLTAAKIHQSARCNDRDIRKFLDGIYITDRTTMEEQI